MPAHEAGVVIIWWIITTIKALARRSDSCLFSFLLSATVIFDSCLCARAKLSLGRLLCANRMFLCATKSETCAAFVCERTFFCALACLFARVWLLAGLPLCASVCFFVMNSPICVRVVCWQQQEESLIFTAARSADDDEEHHTKWQPTNWQQNKNKLVKM